MIVGQRIFADGYFRCGYIARDDHLLHPYPITAFSDAEPAGAGLTG
jgi:hypothetical protein